jgi:hypothetical protein
MEKQDLEKRKHRRYDTIGNALVFSPNLTGRVVNISEGGMAIDVIDKIETELSANGWKTTFYCMDTDTMIKGLPLKLARKGTVEFSPLGSKNEIIGVEFDEPSILQQEQISCHLSMC